MGIDTRFFGPSAWQLFHYLSFRPHSEKILACIPRILPCRFCRESSARFVRQLPMKKDTGKWLYEIHNLVNHKLRTQCHNDPAVINPGPNPTFESVKSHYETLKLPAILGRDFLFSIAVNYPDTPTPTQKHTQEEFIAELRKVYPVDITSYPAPTLHSRKEYMKWMYGLFEHIHKDGLPTYNGYVQRLMYYTSGCDKPTYKGKTCRRIGAGLRTKVRDHRRTHRLTHAVLSS